EGAGGGLGADHVWVRAGKGRVVDLDLGELLLELGHALGERLLFVGARIEGDGGRRCVCPGSAAASAGLPLAAAGREQRGAECHGAATQRGPARHAGAVSWSPLVAIHLLSSECRSAAPAWRLRPRW